MLGGGAIAAAELTDWRKLAQGLHARYLIDDFGAGVRFLADPDGTRSATLVGSRQLGVTFTDAFFIPSGVWDEPHSHIADAHLVVAQGELRLGYGNSLDRGFAARYPAGSFLYVPGNAVHFDGAEEDTILLGTAVGPWSTDYLNS